MPALLNLSPFSADTFRVMDPEARHLEVIVVAATFEVTPDGSLVRAKTQLPVHKVDEHFGAPESSSIRYESDLAWEKPLVDVIVNGTAYAPRGRAARRVVVSLRVGSLQKSLSVSGDRVWRVGLFGRRPSSPRRFTSMPIVYERAFGGMVTDRKGNPARGDPSNPLGVGYRRAKSASDAVETEVPNVEYLSRRVGALRRSTRVAGFASQGRNFGARVRYAGTYDERWKSEQAPLLPKDFDPLYFQSSPPDQRLRELKGGERVELRNLTPSGTLRFSLPRLDVPILLRYQNRLDEADPRCDTLLIEPDENRVVLTSRLTVPVSRDSGPLLEVLVGHMTKGLRHSLRVGKDFRDPLGREGRVPSHAHFG